MLTQLCWLKVNMADFCKRSNPVVPKLCSTDPKVSATTSRGIRGYISVKSTLKSDIVLKSNRGTDVRSTWQCVYLAWPLEYQIKKPPVPTKQATVILIKVKSCSALLRMLLVCIGIYLKSFLRYAFLISDTQHPDTLWARLWGYMVILRNQKGPGNLKVWETLI